MRPRTHTQSAKNAALASRTMRRTIRCVITSYNTPQHSCAKHTHSLSISMTASEIFICKTKGTPSRHHHHRACRYSSGSSKQHTKSNTLVGRPISRDYRSDSFFEFNTAAGARSSLVVACQNWRALRTRTGTYVLRHPSSPIDKGRSLHHLTSMDLPYPFRLTSRIHRLLHPKHSCLFLRLPP